MKLLPPDRPRRPKGRTDPERRAQPPKPDPAPKRPRKKPRGKSKVRVAADKIRHRWRVRLDRTRRFLANPFLWLHLTRFLLGFGFLLTEALCVVTLWRMVVGQEECAWWIVVVAQAPAAALLVANHLLPEGQPEKS